MKAKHKKRRSRRFFAGVGAFIVALIAVIGMFVVPMNSAQAGGDHGHDKPWICHPVNGKGETGSGWNLISPSHTSSHIDEDLYPDGVYWKHEAADGRHDVYASEGKTCPEPPAPNPEGNLTVSADCESITVGVSGVKPEDAEVVVKLNGDLSSAGTHQVPAGEYTVTLWVNGNKVDSKTVTVKECPPPDACPDLPGNQPERTDCTPPKDDRETRDLPGVVDCSTDTYTVQHQERTREYSWDGDSWESGVWSEWATYDTTVTEATDEQCPPQTPDPVIAPAGSITVDCTGAGVATADNSKSTTSVGFEVVVGGEALLYSLNAGEVRKIEFSGAKPGSKVTLQDGEATELDSAVTPPKCKQPTTTPPSSTPSAPQVTPPAGGGTNSPTTADTGLWSEAESSDLAYWPWVLAGGLLLAAMGARRIYRGVRRRGQAD